MPTDDEPDDLEVFMNWINEGSQVHVENLEPQSPPQLVGVGGFLTSGKDSFADFLVEDFGWKKHFMSDRLAQALYALDPWIPIHKDEFPEYRYYIKGAQFDLTWMRYADLVDVMGYTEVKKSLEVRSLLQKLGTEVGRNIIGRNTWVDLVAKDIQETLDDWQSVVITGIRYQNEVEMIQDLGGTLVWVNRPGLVVDRGHSSENSVSERDFDWVIENDGTLEDLRRSTAALVGSLVSA